MRGGLMATMAAVALLGCTNDGTTQEATLPTPPATVTVASTTPAVTEAPATSAAPTSVVATTTSSTTTVAATVAPGVVGLSPDGPWHLVDSAPGITTPGLVYELMPKLWAFIQVEETDASTYSWTLNEADRPIIEAYLQAQLTYGQAATSDPPDLDQPGWERFFADGMTPRREALRQRRLDGQVADLDLGVVYQPQVLSDERTATTAVVADCVLDGGVFRMPDGSLAPGSTSGVTKSGKATRLELLDGQWKITEEGSIDGGCLA